MADINLTADYVISAMLADGGKGALSNLKLQKLLYYIEAWHLGILGTNFYSPSENFEAWVHGPVNRNVYERFAETKFLYSDISLNDRINNNPQLNKDDKEFVDYILENYGRFTGMDLETMTHNEQPWQEARGGLGPFDACNKIISVETMKSYYQNRYARL